MAEGEKQPHFVSKSLLDALGGIKDNHGLVDGGAYLWGAEDREKGRGILNHVLTVSRLAYTLGKELKEKGVAGFEELNLRYLVEAAVLHDVTKLFGEDREKLPLEVKRALVIADDFKEISLEVDEVGISWLKSLGFVPEVYEAIRGHDFPLKIVDDPYWKIVLVADYMAGQKVMSTKDRLADVKERWITKPLSEGRDPRIEPERFDVAEENINTAAREIFTKLGLTDEEFIAKFDLNSSSSQTRWEKFLRRTALKNKEERAKHLVELFIGQ